MICHTPYGGRCPHCGREEYVPINIIPSKLTILVTGGSGMLGQAIKLPEDRESQFNLVKVGSSDYDLTSWEDTMKMFEYHKPTAVIHLAAKVGGVKANTTYVADFFQQNIAINTNVLTASRVFGTKKVTSVLSTCIYPDGLIGPIREDQLHDGPPHDSNFGYAYAKRMLEVQSRAFNQQFGDSVTETRYSCVIPTNMYGPHDNFDLEDGHVIPAIIRKLYEAKINGTVPTFWGSGNPLRQFIHVEDAAKIIMAATIYLDAPPLMNLAFDKAVTIKSVVGCIARHIDYSGEIIWDRSQPEGQYRKDVSNDELIRFMESHKVSINPKLLSLGLKETCDWFVKNYPNVRGCEDAKN